jgi:hypothetical protein
VDEHRGVLQTAANLTNRAADEAPGRTADPSQAVEHTYPDSLHRSKADDDTGAADPSFADEAADVDVE